MWFRVHGLAFEVWEFGVRGLGFEVRGLKRVSEPELNPPAEYRLGLVLQWASDVWIFEGPPKPIQHAASVVGLQTLNLPEPLNPLNPYTPHPQTL